MRGSEVLRSLRYRPGHLRVSGDGVFYTLQGEGITMGKPAVFLRLHICNLACSWCDAKYTWDPQTREFWHEVQQWSINETVERIKAAWGCNNDFVQKRLVVTGGEPLIQKDELDKLLSQLPGWAIEVETNGTVEPTPLQLRCCQFNCSPKLSNSGMSANRRIHPEVIQILKGVNSWFKFVMETPQDLAEVESDFVLGCGINPNKVILMPQGITSTEVWSNAQEVAEVAKVRGYRLMGRLHVDIWGGAKRKV